MGHKSSRLKCKSLQLSSSESVIIPASNIPQQNSTSKLKKFASKLYSLHTLKNNQAKNENISPSSKLISFQNKSKMSIKRENSPLKQSTELKISKRNRNTQNFSSSPNPQPRCSFIDNMGFSQLIESMQKKNSIGPSLSGKTKTFFNVPSSPIKLDLSPNVRKFTIINKEESKKKENKNNSLNKEKIKLNRDLIKSKKRKSDLKLEKNEENIPNKQNIKFESPLIREERKINEKLVLSDYFATFYRDYLNSVKDQKPKSDVLLFKSDRTKASDDLIERTKNLKQKILTEEHEFDLNAERSGKYVDSNIFDNDLIFNKFDKIKERIKFLNSHINTDNVREQEANLKKLSFYKHISKEVEVQQERFQLIQKSQLKNKLKQNKNIDLNKKPKEKPIHIFKNDKELIFYKKKIIQILNDDDKSNFSEKFENNDLLSKINNMKMSPTEFMLRNTKKRSSFI